MITLRQSPGRTHRRRTLAGVFVLLTLAIVATQSPEAIAVLVRDGVWALLLIAGACGWGLWPMAALRLEPRSRSWTILGATALGLGILSGAALGLGCLGMFRPVLWWGVLLFGVGLGVTYMALRRSELARRSGDDGVGAASWLVLILAPFLALGILCATTPPGVLWAEEGFGYDVLEYHLGLPKEYFVTGRIAYLPHNVYANFPANVEMLYLWTMVLRGDPWRAVFTAKMLNLLLGMLAVCGCWLAGREISRKGAILAAALMGGSGWLVYLSGVAYVENSLLWFGALSFAATFRSASDDTPNPHRWALLAGVMAGLACGCKYSAVGLVAVPLLFVLVVVAVRRRARALARPLVFLVGVVAAFSPWLIKNSVMTGDPLFPLGRQVLADYPAGWDAERDEHFRTCHSPQPDEASVSGRLHRFRQRILVDPDQRIGTWLWVLSLAAGLVFRRDRTVAYLWFALGVQVCVWLFASHLYARFGVPMLIPLALLVARLGPAARTALASRVLIGVMSAGLAVNLFFAARLYAEHLYPQGKHLPVHGLVRLFEEGQWPGQEHLGALNALPADAKVLMVGDARSCYVRATCDYCVVFNRNPLAVDAERMEAAAVLDGLRDQGYTHVYVNWAEISRLRNSQYGFPDEITRQLFDDLQAIGLEMIDVFRIGGTGPAYGHLYRAAAP